MHISIPSDACIRLFPDNTMSSFRVKLAHTLKLDRSQHVLGLSSIEWPHTFNNINHPDLKLEVQVREGVWETPIKFRIEEGYYEDVDEVVSALNEQLIRLQLPNRDHRHILNGKAHAWFTFERHSGRVSFIESEDSPARFRLGMHWQLFCKLGFALEKSATPRVKSGDYGDFAADLNAGINAMYIYCDAVDDVRMVGEIMSPLLRIIPVQGNNNEVRHFEPKHIEYLPLRHDDVREIKVELRNDLGELVKFRSGKAVITLHIKKREAAD